ncbi:ABC transporter substrate-binding protein [uncultured Pseudokineococcus sp.]|uniref:ABC transporter substrate-binding protein n=1 Tax=uncultured Pseudokineococcus sp. TaxID=1642928 RepID=UPI002629CE60|nr:ABC transporter substrate-binding protein [uncultured Pseudokineococcus sp.]
MSPRTRKRSTTAVAGGLGLIVALAGCASQEEAGVATSENTAGAEIASSEIDCEQFEQFGDIAGSEVEVYTTIVDPESQSFIDAFGPFTECTDVEINYNGSRQFEAQLPVRVEGGNAPDIAFLPQPGLLERMVATGQVAEPAQAVVDNVDEFWSEDWKSYGTVDGTFYAPPLGANVKSFVWYSPTAFAEAGYEVPETWDEMLALSDQIVADHPESKPWCAGIGSGEATGWPATDFLEDVVLHQQGPDVYDQWVAHEIPFDDPAIAESLATAGGILKNPDYVNGGLGDVRSIASTEFQDAGLPILDGNCWMHRQASFYQANWPAGTDVSEEGDVFAFPTPVIDEGVGSAIVGGGEFVAAFNDEPATQAVQYWLSTGDWANLKAQASQPGWFSANLELDASNLQSPIDQLAVEQLQDPESTFRFDASDLMPAQVGSDAEWQQLTDWIASDQPDDVTLANIEAAWPQ